MNQALLDSLEEVADPAPAMWLAARLQTPGAREAVVGTVTPGGFEAYARVLHPAFRWSAVSPEGPATVRWRDVARWSGRRVHPEVQWEALASPVGPVVEPAPWTEEPNTGHLSSDARRRLASILRCHTSAPDPCWLCFWDGFAEIGLVFSRPPIVHLPFRSYHLARAPLSSLVSPREATDYRLSDLSPNLWWPDDRAWCVATEIDFRWTYVGGSAACIAAVLDDPELEALPAELWHRADSLGDAINAG